MDALRLIRTARHALAEARDVPDVLLEAWQAGLLTEAVGARIADGEEGELAALGQLLCEAGAHVAGCLEPSPESSAALGWGGAGRASRLTDLGELDPLIEELGRLLHEATETLVVLACGAEAESLYWTCIDGVDAGAECRDVVTELHRAVREAHPPGGAAGSATAGERSEGVGGPAAAGGRGHAADAADAADMIGVEVIGVDGEQPVGRGAGVPGGGAGRRPGAGDPAPVRSAESGVPMLVVPLAPPTGRARCRSYGASGGPAATPEPGAPVASEGGRAAPPPARAELTDASNSRICSSRPLGVSGASDDGLAPLGSCGVTAAVDHGSDMRGPLRLGSAV